MATFSNSVIVQDPEIHSGEPVFRGTRVPFRRYWITWKAEKRWTNSWSNSWSQRETAIAALEEAKALILARFGNENPDR